MRPSCRFQSVQSCTLRGAPWCGWLHAFRLVWGPFWCRHLFLCLHRLWLHCHHRWDGNTWTRIHAVVHPASLIPPATFPLQEKKWRIPSEPFPRALWPRCLFVLWHTLVCPLLSLRWCRTTYWTRTALCRWPLNTWAGMAPLMRWPLALYVPCPPGKRLLLLLLHDNSLCLHVFVCSRVNEWPHLYGRTFHSPLMLLHKRISECFLLTFTLACSETPSNSLE